MDQETIVLKIRDHDPLRVSVERLTADSRMFRYLICDLHFTELEMDDFHPDTVFIFLALLEEKTVEDIQEGNFRELHKMSVVFEVAWLMESCREWLANKINGINSDVMEYEATLFLLEECRYILNKWEVSKFVNLLISKLAAMDNVAFISHYMRDFDELNSNQMDLMLKLGGSNTKVFLEIVLQNITGKQFLDTNTKYLLDNMNLALCLAQNEQLYDQMFETMSAMSELTNTDLRFILKLATESAVTSRSRKTRISTKTTIWDEKEWYKLMTCCETLEDILLRVEDKRINSMFAVVMLLFEVTWNNHLTAEEVDVFIDRLENVCRDSPLIKVFPQFIDSFITFLTLSHREEKVQLIALLEKIQNNSKLSSCHDYIIFDIGRTKSIEVERSPCTKVTLPPVMFNFKHPGIPMQCGMPGKCGFLISRSHDESYNWKLELCKEADYEGTEVHYHDVMSAEDMHYFRILSYTPMDGTGKTYGRLYHLWYIVSWSRWNRWVPSRWQLELYEHSYIDGPLPSNSYIAYNTSKHLVAKQD